MLVALEPSGGVKYVSFICNVSVLISDGKFKCRCLFDASMLSGQMRYRLNSELSAGRPTAPAIRLIAYDIFFSKVFD